MPKYENVGTNACTTLDARCLSQVRLLLLLATVLTSLTAQADVLIDTDLFVGRNFDSSSPDPSPQYRIPSIIQTSDGSLLAFMQARIGPADPGQQPGGQELHLKRSSDRGQTWSSVNVLLPAEVDGQLWDYNAWSPVNLDNGDLGFFYGRWPDATRTTQQFWMTSSDGGVSFSEPVEITDQIEDPSWTHADAGPGRGIRLQWQTDPSRNGRIVLTGKHDPGPGGFAALSFTSDDSGTTWSVGAPTSGPNGAGNENEVVELTDGRLLMDARNQSSGHRERWISLDGGGTWTYFDQSDFFITPVDGSMIRYSAIRRGDDRDRLLFSGPLGSNTDPNTNSGKNRQNMAVWTSYDEGQSFINPVQMNTGPGGYSALERLDDGTIAILYERPANDRMAFTRFDLSHLEGADHPTAMSHYDGFGNPVDGFRGGVGWTGAWATTGNVNVKPGSLEFPGFFTADDDQHLRVADGGELTRSLGTSKLDLNQTQDYFFSLFAEKVSDATSTDEFLSIRLDQNGSRQFAFGVAGDGAFFVGNADPSSNVLASEFASPQDTYLLLGKLAAQDDSLDNFDQIFLSVFPEGAVIPKSESEVNWIAIGSTTDNLDGMIDSISIRTGDLADWNVDGLRIGSTFAAVIVDTGVVPLIVGDLTGDGLVNQEDIQQFVFNWRTSGWEGETEQIAHGDLNFDTFVNLADAFILHEALSNHGVEVPFADLLGIPEPPSGWMLLGLCTLLAARRQYVFSLPALSCVRTSASTDV